MKGAWWQGSQTTVQFPSGAVNSCKSHCDEDDQDANDRFPDESPESAVSHCITITLFSTPQHQLDSLLKSVGELGEPLAYHHLQSVRHRSSIKCKKNQHFWHKSKDFFLRTKTMLLCPIAWSHCGGQIIISSAI